MTITLLIITIVTYILSLVAAAILTLSYRRISLRSTYFFFSLHLLLLVGAFLTNGFIDSEKLRSFCYLSTVASGLILAGLALRKKEIPGGIRYYAFLFLFTIPVFIYSPSWFFYQLSGHGQEFRPAQSFHLTGNVYLVEQSSMIKQDGPFPGYKIIAKYGIYNKSLSRNVSVGQAFDSVKLILLDDDTILFQAQLQSGADTLISLKPGMKKDQLRKGKR